MIGPMAQVHALTIQPLSHPVNATVRVPGSKSYTNRALVAAALAEGVTVLNGALFSDDTLLMASAIESLGIQVARNQERSQFVIHGLGGRIPSSTADLFVGNAGTAARFLPPLLALGHGNYTLDGVRRMRKRPIKQLLDALTELGGTIKSVHDDGSIPIRIVADGLEGGTIRIPTDMSSQFASGLLLSAPYMRRGLQLTTSDKVVSRPYLDMTVATMAAFGVDVMRPDEHTFVVAPGAYKPCTYSVGPDASAASYFFAAAAICGGRICVEGLGRGSLQGDLRIVEILKRMGCTVEQNGETTVVAGPGPGSGPGSGSGPRPGGLVGVDVNMADLSDVAQTIAVVAPFASSPTRIMGIGFVRGKETDRIRAVVTELRRLGVDANEEEDGLVIRPGAPHAGQVHTYNDHRMAMSFALIGLVVPGITILDPGCVTKTFPNYFEVLASLRD